MKAVLKRFWLCESGQPAIEYCTMAAGIAILLLSTLKLIGEETIVPFQKMSDGLDQAP